ncbi:MAG: hypothetical protein AAGG48_27715 [Planctomycetota bacterium]
MHLVRAILIPTLFFGFGITRLFAQENGHFSTWKDIPKIVNSISEDDFRQQLEQLHQLTWIKLGFPQTSLCLSDDEHRRYMLQTKRKWRQWWESTGIPVSIQKERNAKVDQHAFQMAWEFLGTKQQQPKSIPPVWIPTTWTLYVTFTNGDYMGREKELWSIERQAGKVSLTKVRGDYSQGDWNWNVVLTQYDGLTPHRADQILKSLCYLHRYAPTKKESVPENEMVGLYYPHSTLHLRDSKNRTLWNTEGYTFGKAQPDFGDGEAGRSYFFLRSTFSDAKKWREPKPTSELLAPYRVFLSFSKPYFCSVGSEIICLFGNSGGQLERQALLEWAEKQKTATNPEMDWDVCCDEFGTAAKVNVLNFTRLELQTTVKEIRKIGDRLAENQGGVMESDFDRTKERELERYVAQTLINEQTEREDLIESYPQPLRDLIRADEHPHDSDLKHLSVAVQAFRDQPDPRLFRQLVEEMDEGTLRIRTLLRLILLNGHDALKLKPWEVKQKTIAVGSCVDALPDAKNATDDLIEILLQACGGGKIEFEGQDGGLSIEVTLNKNGFRVTRDTASDPLSLKEAQQELRRLYAESKLGQKGAHQPVISGDER